MAQTVPPVLDRPPSRPDRGVPVAATAVVLAVLAASVLRPLFAPWLDVPSLQLWSTVFVALMIQATPFLLLGVVVSGALAALVPPAFIARVLPRNGALAVGAGACAGTLLPGCECGSVPISGRLVSRGAPPAAALAFMLAAPAINPIVLLSTAVAFPGQPEVVAARFLASLATAVVVGLIWLRRGDDEALVRALRRIHDRGDRLSTFVATTRHDFLLAGGYLVLGAAVAATAQTVVPPEVIDTVAGNVVLAVAVLTLLAIILSICSEADAFVVAGLPQFPMVARLAFLVVGPVVDIKLVAMQAGVFGKRFAVTFAPLALVVSLTAAVLVGWWLL
ncbi:permease [Nitriliruptor alkaliphilus]|uniref:permease n=1 Tax=Nitriliruptor alkaliphilus TaxID=427918 RepID=UPI000698EE0E|nr:permease [Nitriliruptor alkaliphilus]